MVYKKEECVVNPVIDIGNDINMTIKEKTKRFFFHIEDCVVSALKEHNFWQSNKVDVNSDRPNLFGRNLNSRIISETSTSKNREKIINCKRNIYHQIMLENTIVICQSKFKK